MRTKQEKQSVFIGIDVSKLTLDVCMISFSGNEVYQQFSNNPTGFEKMEQWLHVNKQFSYASGLFCMEYTGLYTRELVQYLLMQQGRVWMESALHLKRSMGMTRGKNDKVDSYRIARYAMTNQEKMKL